MNYTRTPLNLMGCAARVLGQVSLWMGTLFAISWSVLFAMMARHLWAFRGSSAGLWLPFEPPLIGLALAVLGLTVAPLGRQPIAVSAVAGFVLNGLALTLALALLCGCLG